MSEMVERIAKRLYESRPGGDGDRIWRSNGCETREWLDQARVAIEAMKVPTEKMWTAGASETRGTAEIWRAMIDEALK